MEKITTKIDGNKLLPTELKEQNIIIHPVDERPKNDYVTIEAIKKYIEKLPPEGPINKIIPE